MADDPGGDQRREDSVYGREHEVPERLLRDLSRTRVLTEKEINRGAAWHDSKHAGEVTEKQLEVIWLLTFGYSPEMAAEQLQISESAIRDRIRAARNSLNAKTTPHLVALAFRRGLID